MPAGLDSYPRADWACFAALADRRGSVASQLAALLPPFPSVSMFFASLHWFSSVKGAVVLGGHSGSLLYLVALPPPRTHPPAHQSMSFKEVQLVPYSEHK